MNIGSQNETLGTQIKKGLFWNVLERGSTQIISFVIQLVLARLLFPEDYGVLSLLNVCISLSSTFVNNGLADALIQKKNRDETDMNTVFFVQLALSGFFVVILWLIAPFVAAQYGKPILAPCLRVMSLVLIVQAFSAMQIVKLKITMQFKKLFASNICGVLVQSAVGVYMALRGYGVWSLVWSQVAFHVASYLVVLVTVHWMPRLLFSFARLRQLFSYSWKLFVGWIIGTVHQDVYALIIGKWYSAETLGHYNRGSNLPSTVTKIVRETMSNVMFPALSKVQEERQQFKEYTRKMMTLTAFVIWPIVAGIAAVSENFVMVVLTDKWAPSIPMMQLFALAYGFNMTSVTNMQAFNALGRSNVFLKMEVIKRSISIGLLLVACALSLDILLVIGIVVVMGVFSLVYNVLTNRKLLQYTVREQMGDMLPPMLVSLVMFGFTFLINFLPATHLVKLILQVAVGVTVYVFVSLLCKLKAVDDFKAFLKNQKAKR